MDTFRVMVLGGSGSGKTVMLASMYTRLCVQHKDIGFYFEVPEDTKKILMADYNDLSNPKKGWPPGSTGVREWHFTGTYSDGRKNIPVFEMLYADYAGGYLSDTDISHKDLDFDAPTGSVLMLLDGHKLQRSLSGSSPQSTQELVEDLRDMLPIAMKKIGVPMHFVVTKDFDRIYLSNFDD